MARVTRTPDPAGATSLTLPIPVAYTSSYQVTVHSQPSGETCYGITSGGGESDDGVVFKITPSGTETVLYSFAGGTIDGALPMGSLLQGSDGNLYGMTSSGGAGSNGTVFEFN